METSIKSFKDLSAQDGQQVEIIGKYIPWHPSGKRDMSQMFVRIHLIDDLEAGMNDIRSMPELGNYYKDDRPRPKEERDKWGGKVVVVRGTYHAKLIPEDVPPEARKYWWPCIHPVEEITEHKPNP